MAPTTAADDLARAIAAHLDALEASLDTLRLRPGSLQGTVHIAGPVEFLSVRLVPMILPLQAQGLKIRLQTGNRDRVRALLDEGAVDLARRHDRIMRRRAMLRSDGKSYCLSLVRKSRGRSRDAL